MLPQRARALAVASSTALALGLVACDASVQVDLAPAASAPPRGPSPAAEPTPSPKPSDTLASTPSPSPSRPSPSSPSSSPPASPGAVGSATGTARPRKLSDRLLEAAAMPGFEPSFRWRALRTRTVEGEPPFGTCQRFGLTTIGAMRTAVREYSPATASPGRSAGHLVAEFADRTTARRAYEVLRSWRAQCEEQLQGHDRRRVGSLQPVSVPDGEAGWYLLVYGPARGAGTGEAYVDAQGMVLHGRRIALLEMRLVGQDDDYPADGGPMVRAVRTAAARLG